MLTHFLLYSRLKTKDKGTEKEGWNIKCRTVYELLVSEFSTVTPVEAGKIDKKAFPFLRRQRYTQEMAPPKLFTIKLDYSKPNLIRQEKSSQLLHS